MGSEAFEAIAEDSRASFTAKIDLSGIGVSLISKNLVEVVYLTLGGVVLEYAMSVTSQALSLAVELVQLDNQLHEGVYPVVLQPTPIAQQSRKNGTLPCVQASIYLLNDDSEHTC
jgi:vacuolar protein sorting-associated protein 13A/C